MEQQWESGDTRPRSASGAGASGADAITERWTIAEGQSRVIDLDAVQSLRVGVVGGSVDIVGHDEPTARVEVHRVEGRDLTVTLEQGRLSIAHPRVSWDDVWESVKALVGVRARVELSILVPRQVALSLGQVSASALVSGLSGQATLSTVSGPLQVESHRGDLDLNTVSGDVEVSGGAGSLSVHAVSADVTASGALTDIGVDTVSGEVLLDVHGSPRSISANTVSADVTLRLDAGQGVRATTRTVSGRGSVVGRSLPKRGGSETIDGASAFGFSANTVSGDITVVRRDA
ncbi:MULTISPECIES: DUF4097 family beta strand repeat-containing protein [unclassified Agrococcus]|uniref:DUF4097 family beta strand repeat-containing protein n=1 Tax=unclassified Agrococcus TaxID=2615065 RepID=UPI001FF483DF|nr:MULTISPECIES: DUF4097 family beta strand repeat-containing protein [unclassified Agrococcus]MDR7233323.1 hypothetical protein [Agrococcus sp. BE272]UOV99703.1 DUF4097 domain-containing protein [Agrococcus sp. SCSIO52902]